MRKYVVLSGILAAAVLLYNCSSAKKAAGSVPAASAYESNIKSVIEANCSPCHIPAKGGNKKAYDNFANVRADVDEIIRRIGLNPGERGFMPFKRAKLGDSTIAIFRKWKSDGLAEK